tara:strand:+ start:263 stop:412 length:150 start_codon:yes stop_codon:yes gene_type:complete
MSAEQHSWVVVQEEIESDWEVIENSAEDDIEYCGRVYDRPSFSAATYGA